MISATRRPSKLASHHHPRPFVGAYRRWPATPICTSVGGTSDSSPEDPLAGASELDLSSAMLKSLTEVAKAQGRTTNKTNLFLVGETEESWRRLDKK